jgi:predicted DNA-binding transcriptional regulator
MLNPPWGDPEDTELANDRALGGTILILSVVGIVVYGLLLWFWPLLILEITAFLAVIVLLGILAWIGWTMATTPPPEPITDTPPPAPAPSAEKKTA